MMMMSKPKDIKAFATKLLMVGILIKILNFGNATML
jgi:hypothetical protein